MRRWETGRTFPSLRQREDIDHATFRCRFGKVGHCISEPERSRAVALGIQPARYYGTGPAAHSGNDCNVLLTVWPAIRNWLRNDAGSRFELPESGASSSVGGFEPTFHGSVEDNVSSRHHG